VFAAAMGFAPRATWEVSIAASELATNAIKFAGGGSLVLSKLTTPREALELVMSDHGEGIRDVEAAVVDRFSEGALLGADHPRRPGQGLGVGLGSVHRMMDAVEVGSSNGNGTRIRALKYR
jgi:serine/threonine-protein kinase RsbT